MADRGQFGDMFGAVNALFTGLAFAGVVITLYQQREERRYILRQLKKEEFAARPMILWDIRRDSNDIVWLLFVSNKGGAIFDVIMRKGQDDIFYGTAGWPNGTEMEFSWKGPREDFCIEYTNTLGVRVTELFVWSNKGHPIYAKTIAVQEADI